MDNEQIEEPKLKNIYRYNVTQVLSVIMHESRIVTADSEESIRNNFKANLRTIENGYFNYKSYDRKTIVHESLSDVELEVSIFEQEENSLVPRDDDDEVRCAACGYNIKFDKVQQHISTRDHNQKMILHKLKLKGLKEISKRFSPVLRELNIPHEYQSRWDTRKQETQRIPWCTDWAAEILEKDFIPWKFRKRTLDVLNHSIALRDYFKELEPEKYKKVMEAIFEIVKHKRLEKNPEIVANIERALVLCDL